MQIDSAGPFTHAFLPFPLPPEKTVRRQEEERGGLEWKEESQGEVGAQLKKACSELGPREESVPLQRCGLTRAVASLGHMQGSPCQSGLYQLKDLRNFLEAGSRSWLEREYTRKEDQSHGGASQRNRNVPARDAENHLHLSASPWPDYLSGSLWDHPDQPVASTGGI